MTSQTNVRQPLAAPEDDEVPVKTEFCQMANMAVQLSSVRIVRMLLTTMDSAFLGHLGTKQLAGVSLSAMWQGVPSTFVQFTIQALTTLASQAKGSGDNRLVGLWLQVALIVAVVGTIPVMIIFYNVHWMVGLTMDDEETLNYSREFSQMMAWSLLPQFVYAALTSYFSTIDVVMPATFCTCFTVCANFVFNWVFIYGIGGWKGFGFIGSPLATVTSSWLQLLIFSVYCFKIRGYHKPYWGGFSKEALSGGRMRSFLALGIPTGVSSVVDWASGAIVGSFSGWCGVDVAAAQNVLNSLFSLTYSIVSGFSTATQIRLARYLGQGKPLLAQRILKIGSATLLTGGVIMCFLIAIFHDSVWRIWTKDPKLVGTCNTALFCLMACIIMAYLRFTLTVVCVSLGPKEASVNLIANNIASWAIFVPLAYLFSIQWNWALTGFWWSDFCGEAFKVVCLGWAVSRVDWVQAANDARARQLNKDAASPALSHSPSEPAQASPKTYAAPSPQLTGGASRQQQLLDMGSPQCVQRIIECKQDNGAASPPVQATSMVNMA